MFELQSVTAEGQKELKELSFDQILTELIIINNDIETYSHYRVVDLNDLNTIVEWSAK